MPTHTNKSLKLAQFFEIAAKNQTKHNILRLDSEALTGLLPEACTQFKDTLKQNNTLTYLSLSSAPLPTPFIPTLLAALAENKSIIDLEYNPEGLTLETVKQIKSFIRRNRKACLQQKIEPRPISILEVDEPGVLFSDAEKAVEQGDLNKLAALLPHIPNWFQKVNDNMYSLLHTAAANGQVACVRYLISQGAKVDFNPKFIGTPNGTALFAAVKNNHYLITYLLLKAGASTQEKANGFPILHWVRTVELARLLVDYQANPLALCGEESSVTFARGNTALHTHLHFQTPNLDLIRYFLQGNLNVNACNEYQETPLFDLVLNFDLKPDLFLRTLNLLIRKGSNLDWINDQGKTAHEMAQKAQSRWTPYLAAAEQEMKTLTHSAVTLKNLLCKPGTNPFFQFFPPEVRIKIIDATEDYKTLDDKNREELIIKQLS